MANPGEILLDKINNKTDKQILLNGLPYETFINDIKEVITSITPNPPYKNTFEQFITLLNGKDEANEEIFKINTADPNWVAIQDETTFRAYYTSQSHTAIKNYFTIKIMKILFKDIFSTKDEIQKFNKAKEEEEKKKGNLWNSVLPQPNFTDGINNEKIKEKISKILQGQETEESLKNKLDDDKRKEYTLLNDNKTDFNTINNPLIDEFVTECIDKANSQTCPPHVGKILNTDNGVLIEYFESQIKKLPRDKLLRIAKGLDIRVYPPTGLFENEKLWEKHTNFLNVSLKGQNKEVSGILANEFLNYSVKVKIGGADVTFPNEAYPKNEKYDEKISDLKTNNTAENAEAMSHVFNKKQERITTIKGNLLGFVKVLSHELNEKKFETEEKDKKDRPNSRFNKDVVQYSILNNYRLIPTNPYSYFIWGGKFELKPNKNQTADILEKMIKALLESLRAHNKYLNTEDIQLIYTAIDKLRKFETYLGELLVEASNYAENIQKEKDMTQQYITINKIKDNNKKINETTTKIATLKQKIEYLVNTLYTQRKEEENKTKQTDNKEDGITINY